MVNREVRLESLIGNGRVYHPGGSIPVETVRYRVEVSQTMLGVSPGFGSSGAGEEVPGLKTVRGQIVGAVPSLFNLVGQDIELEFEDGRRWECLLQSTDGNLVNRGQGFK